MLTEWLLATEKENKNRINRIGRFLSVVDEAFIPSLNSRVDIYEYSKKLSKYADNLFFVENGVDIAECSVYCNTDIAYISSIAVLEEYRGKGIGKAMLKMVYEHCVERGCNSIVLHTASEHNVEVEHFYIKNGFSIEKRNRIMIELKRKLN